MIGGGIKKGPVNRLDSNSKRSNVQKLGLILSIVANLSFLGFFKYYNFFIDNFNDALTLVNLQGLRLNDVVTITLPLGISFYTFQAMSYTIDVYRGKVAANRNLLKIATYITMFPQLVAGPIVRYVDIENQLNNHKVRVDQFVEGIKRFIIGLAKKVLIANTMAKVVDHVFELSGNDLTTGVAWIGVFAYSFQIYFDFSGYSCMAIGIGKMLGFDFPENFNYPYISRSIKEFWRRWHISLSIWFRDYLYFSLGGSRDGKYKTYRNLIIVFFLCGLWHGASWNFVIWGLFHGIFLVLERTGFGRLLSKIPSFFQHFYVLLIVMIGWVFFRSDDLSGSLNYLEKMFAFKSDDIYLVRELLQADVIIALIAGFIFSTPVMLKFMNIMNSSRSNIRPVLELSFMIFLFGLFVICAMSLSAGTYNPFIYFRF